MTSKASLLSAFVAVANTTELASIPVGSSLATSDDVDTAGSTAYSNAVSTAATDASDKAATAYSNVVSYAAANTYVNTTFAPKADPTFTGTVAANNLTVTGNLTVSGTTTYINTTNLNIGDNIISLNADLGASAPTENAGISVNRGSSTNVAILWDESIDKWVATNDGITYANIAIGAAGATLVANTTDTATYYLPMSNSTTGSWTNAVISTAVTYVPSTGTMRLGSTGANVSANSSMIRVSANATLHASLGANGLMINGSYGTNGYVLKSTGTGQLWTTISKNDVGLSNVQNLDQQNADNLTYGYVSTARLASFGTANSSTYLRGDYTYAQPALSELANVAISSPAAGQALVYTATVTTIGGTYTPGTTPGVNSITWNKNSNTIPYSISNTEVLSLLTVGRTITLYWNGGANSVTTTIATTTPGYSFDVATANPTGAIVDLSSFNIPTTNSTSYSWKNGSSSAFPSGTAMLFAQTSAPTGWTKQTTHNNKALRVVSGTAGSGGTSAFTSVFGSRTPGGSVSISGSVGSTTLDTSQMPSHRHWTGAYYMDDFNGNNGYLGVQDGDNYYSALYTDYQGGGGSHNHSFGGSASFSGSAMDFDVQYVDVIIATKD